MSTFIVREQTLSIIAGFISFIESKKDPVFPIDAMYPFKSKENDDIFGALYTLNVRAYNLRYDEKISLPNNLNCPYSGLDFTNFVSWYMVVKALDCYLYQVSEGDIPEGEIYKYLVELQKELALYIVKKNKYYDVYTWG